MAASEITGIVLDIGLGLLALSLIRTLKGVVTGMGVMLQDHEVRIKRLELPRGFNE